MPVSLCPAGSPTTQATGPHTQSTKLNLEPIPYHLPNFLLFFTLFYNQKILDALPFAKQELPHTDVSEREKQSAVYISSQQKTLRDAWQKGKRSLLIRGQHMKGLCRVKGNVGGVGRHIYSSCLTSRPVGGTAAVSWNCGNPCWSWRGRQPLCGDGGLGHQYCPLSALISPFLLPSPFPSLHFHLPLPPAP